ncbi:MAG: hypothetical protein ACKOYH_05980 [Cyanobium sp.]
MTAAPLVQGAAAGQLVGQLAALWRYPVKSMLGERLQRLEVDGRGVVG